MGIELDIYKIKCRNSNINLNYIATIYNEDIIWELDSLGCCKCDGSSRSIFEIDGHALRRNINLLLEGGYSINHNFKDDDLYECRIYY